MRVLLLDRDKGRRETVAGLIRGKLPGTNIAFDAMAQHDVFKKTPEAGYAAAFLWSEGILDMEAARQLSRIRPELPLVIYTDSKDYAKEGYAANARHYLLYPINEDMLTQALQFCGMLLNDKSDDNGGKHDENDATWRPAPSDTS